MFKTSKTISNANLIFLTQTCPKLEVIDLGTISIRRQVGDEGLCALARGCPNLTEVVLRRRHNVGHFGLVSLITTSRQNLTVLDLGFCTSVSDQVLAAIGCSSSSIVVLNLEYCYSITDRGLEFLANGCCSKSMKELVLAGCPRISDYGVSLLRKMCVLQELSLDDCRGNITDIGGVAISKIPTLKVLNFGMLRSVTNRTVVAIAQNCLGLEMLDVKGCTWVTGAGIRAFSGHKFLESLNLFCCGSYIRGSDLECVALGCPSLKSFVLDQKLGT